MRLVGRNTQYGWLGAWHGYSREPKSRLSGQTMTPPTTMVSQTLCPCYFARAKNQRYSQTIKLDVPLYPPTDPGRYQFLRSGIYLGRTKGEDVPHFVATAFCQKLQITIQKHTPTFRLFIGICKSYTRDLQADIYFEYGQFRRNAQAASLLHDQGAKHSPTFHSVLFS